MMNYAMFVPTLWNIAREEGVEVVTVALPMLEECLKSGKPIYKGADFPDDRFDINYEAAAKELAAHDYSEQRRFFIKAVNEKFHELAKLWRDKKYPHMCALVLDTMHALQKHESPEEKARYERHKRELAELAEKWKAEMAEGGQE